MTYEEALEVLFKVYGRKQVLLSIDVNNLSVAEVIKYAEEAKAKIIKHLE